MRAPRSLLLLAGGCGVLFVALLGLAYGVAPARWLDAAALQGFVALDRPPTPGLHGLTRALHLGDPAQVALLGGGLALVALARGRPRTALAVVALFAATSVSSEALKLLLAFPRDDHTPITQVGAAAFPSGHATAAMSLAFAGVLVAPRRLRALAALVGAGLALGVGFAVIVRGSHFPSDVVGGYLLATGWAAVVAAALEAAAARWPERSGRARAGAAARAAVDRAAAVGLGAAALAGAGLAAVALVLVLARFPEVVGYAARHTASFAVAPALAASAAGLLAALTVALRDAG